MDNKKLIRRSFKFIGHKISKYNNAIVTMFILTWLLMLIHAVLEMIYFSSHQL